MAEITFGLIKIYSRMKKTITIILPLAVLFACNKHKDDPPNVSPSSVKDRTCTEGTLRITNTSYVSCSVMVDSTNEGIIHGNEYMELKTGKGDHTVYLRQVIGTIDRKDNISILGCDNVDIEFPYDKGLGGK